MNKGIAKRFKEVFGEVKVYAVGVGDLVYVEKGSRFICHLVTTKTEYERPTMRSLEKCLGNLARFLKEKKIQRIAIPRLGCGYGGLQWAEVKKLIKHVFKDTQVEINVYFT